MRLTVVLLAGLISGCALVDHKPTFHNASTEQLERWQLHQQSLSDIKDNWRFVGRIGASTDDDAWTGSIWWQQNLDNYQIELAGPLQQGTIRLSGNAGRATVQLEEGQSYSDSDATTLLERYAGWSIPFSSLRFWVLGLPKPKGEAQQVVLDPNGRIASINTGFWRVEFRKYRQFDQLFLPRKIVLEQAGAKIRLVFDQWAYDG